MRKINISLVLASLTIIFMTSCTSLTQSTKDIKYMSIRFKPLSRTDYTLVGNLEVKDSIKGKMTGNKKVLDPIYAGNYKKGLITKSETTEIMYSAPAAGEAITGALYDNDIFNSIYTPVGPGRKLSFMEKLKAKYGPKTPVNLSDPAVDFAYYAMVAKYPNIDYFINVRFDRKVTMKGKKYTEVITVKADGLVLKTN